MSFFSELKRRNVFRIGAAYFVSAWLLIQVVETIFPLFGFDDTPARIVVIVLAIGFIPSLIFSWTFEFTPEGLKREVDVVNEHSITRYTGKKLDRIIMVLLVLALGYFAFDKFVLDPVEDVQIAESAHQQGRSEALTESYGDKSIAVLPFVNMSSDPEQEYFSDGISEELLNLLSKIPELRVISRTSAFSFKGKNLDIPTVAAQLNVAHILEGSVRKDGNQVRITAQLIEARSDTHLWSETYNRSLENIFAIQDEITADVVNQLKVTLLGAPPTVKETDSESYALYLQARHLWRQGSEEGINGAYKLLRQALDIDSTYAPAWEALGTVYTYQVGLGQLPFEEGYRKAEYAAKRALEIDPNYAQALSDLGWYAMSLQNDIRTAASYFHSARQNAPNDSLVLGNIATFAAVIGRLEDAVDLMKIAIEYDPIDSAKYTNLGAFYLAAGKLDGANVAFEKALEFSPDDVWTQNAVVILRILQNRPSEALQIVESLEHELTRLVTLPMILHDLGQVKQAQAALDNLRGSLGVSVSYFEIAEVYAHLNLFDEAFESLELASENAEDMSSIRISAFLRKLHGDSRWADILFQVGLADEQVSDLEL
jgi:adenylate cyclase